MADYEDEQPALVPTPEPVFDSSEYLEGPPPGYADSDYEPPPDWVAAGAKKGDGS